MLQCRPKAVTAARADAVRVRIGRGEGGIFGRWEPRAATHVDALSCDDWEARDQELVNHHALLFAVLPGLERVVADSGCPENATPDERAQGCHGR